MKNRITFVRPTRGKTSGVEKTCTARQPETRKRCLKTVRHTGQHQWTPNKTVRDRPAKKKAVHALSRETRLDCLQMIEDPAYRRKLLLDLRARKVRPAVECMLWYYAKGKPKEMMEHSGTLSLQQELSALTPEELKARALAVAKMITPTVH